MVANKLARKREQLAKTEIQAQVGRPRWMSGAGCWGGGWLAGDGRARAALPRAAAPRAPRAPTQTDVSATRPRPPVPRARYRQNKEELKTVALGTSKINYLDPRITVAWWVLRSGCCSMLVLRSAGRARTAAAAAPPARPGSRRLHTPGHPPDIPPRSSPRRCKRNEVPIEKVFNKSLLTKFLWAMDVEPGFRF